MPLANLASTLDEGILPLDEVRRRGLAHEDISEPSVQRRREERGLHAAVPLYFTPLTPMAYVRRDRAEDLCHLVIDLGDLCLSSQAMAFTDGNGGSASSTVYRNPAELADHLPVEVIFADYWHHFDDGRRRRSAELLTLPRVPASAIREVAVFAASGAERVDQAASRAGSERGEDGDSP